MSGVWGRLDSPLTVAGAAQALASDAVVIAGGTDAVPMRQAGLLAKAYVVDVLRIEEMRGSFVDAGHLSIGSTTTMAAILAGGAQVRRHRALVDGASVVGSRQTRNAATIGGNICRASPSGDTLAPLLACAGELSLASTRGSRSVAASDFFVGPGRTVCDDDELLLCVRLPLGAGASAYQRITSRRWMDLATVGVAVFIDTDLGDDAPRVRLAVSGAGPTPILVPVPDEALAGLSAQGLLVAVPILQQAAQDAISPIDDVRGSAWYRRRMVNYLVERVTASAIVRLSDEGDGSA